jgi:cytochrome c biogenesis protein CcmG/thiol:disulfide interchange protein DsbE
MNGMKGMNDKLGLVAGLVLVGLVGFTGALGLGLGLDNWDLSQPVGPAEPVPEFEVRLTDGTTLRSRDLGGEVTMLTFWATWCGACSMQMPTYASLEDRFADSDLRIIGVNRDSLPPGERERVIADYASYKEIEFPHALDDGGMANAFRVSGIPHVVLIDRRGQIRHVHVGQIREKVLVREIDELLAE